jgi:proteasome lid subunit RPN8/RPN11
MKNYAAFRDHIVTCYPQEGCGVILNELFYPIDNIHPEPSNNFMFSEKDCLELLDKEYTIIHSHTMERFDCDPRTPSLEDMICRNNTQVPHGIVHCDGENISEILYFGTINTEELLGRSYISNVFDCFTIARDFLYNEANIDIGLHPRPPEWEEWNPYYILHTYKDIGFIDVEETDSYQVGDILLFAISSNKVNHIGIYLEENKFIHHLYNRKSCEDSISKWSKHLIKTIRLVR